MSTVSIEESSRNIHDLLSSPGKHQSRRFSYFRYADRFQVLLCCISHKFFDVFRINNHRHTLLGFGDGKLSSIKTFIFLRHLVQIYDQTVCQLTDCYRHTACTEVITFFNETGYFRTAEQSLDLTLCRSITFLHLSTAGLNGSLGMYFGRTSRTTAAVTSGTAAQQDDDISRIRSLTDHIFSRSSTHNSTNLHTFCHIVRMVNLFYISSSQSNLVTIRAIAAGCTAHQFFLGQFTLQSLRYRNGRVSCAGYTHCLIYISTA